MCPLWNPYDVSAALATHDALVSAHSAAIAAVAHLLTDAAFQCPLATGTFQHYSERINDGDVGTYSEAGTIDQYTEVDFGVPYKIKKYRQYGNVNNNGDGSWKIQYWDGAAWQDWETGIVTRVTADFSAFVAPAAGIKTTTKIRLVCTAVDTKPGSMINALEIRS